MAGATWQGQAGRQDPEIPRTVTADTGNSTVNKEVRYKLACDDLRSGKYTKYTDAAAAYDLSYQTLRHRYLNLHGVANLGHTGQQLLSRVQEEVLVDWCIFLGLMGHPFHRVSIEFKVEQLAGRKPGKHWVKRFLKRHSAELRFRKAAGLDPKRAQAFNVTNVHDHFLKLDTMFKKLNIKWKNMYNMDEKGLQVGGGRKCTGVKYIFGRRDQAMYKIRSDNLELVTVIECVAADGGALKPTFIFKGNASMDMAWLEVDEGVGCVPSIFYFESNLLNM